MRTVKFIKYKLVPALAGISLYFGMEAKSQQSQGPYQDIQCIKLIVKYDFLGRKNNAITMADTFPIFYYKNFIIYALPHTVSLERNDTVLNTSLIYKYYIFKKGDTHGYLYDSLNITTKKVRRPVDTLLTKRAFYDVQIKDDHPYDTLLKAFPGKNELMEKYVVRQAFKGKYFDTAYYYFSKNLLNIPYQLSPSLDSAKKMKLYKVRFIFSGSIIAPKKPRREFSYEVQNVTFDNKNEVMAFFNDFISFYNEKLVEP